MGRPLPDPELRPMPSPQWGYLFAGIAAVLGVAGLVVACVSFALWVSA